jgi:hypothetical protein
LEGTGLVDPSPQPSADYPATLESASIGRFLPRHVGRVLPRHGDGEI